MKKLADNSVKELLIIFRELTGFILIVSFLYGSALLFFRTAYNNTEKIFETNNNILLKGFSANFYTPYAFLTAVLLVIFYYLIFRFLARERAETFGIDTSKPNYLSAVRDYTAVIFFSAVSCIIVFCPLNRSFFIPVSTFAGVVFAWWAMAVVVNIGGFGEPVKETLKDLAVVSGIIIAGKTLPALFGFLSYASPVDYLIEIGIIYVIGPGIGVVTYSGVGITLELSAKKVFACIQSFAVSVFMYFSMPFFAALPAFIMLVPFLIAIGIGALLFLSAGRMSHFSDFSADLFHNMIFPEQNNVFLTAVFSPVIYFLVFFKNLLLSSFSHWAGAVELAAFLSSLHYRLRSYKNRLDRKNISLSKE